MVFAQSEQERGELRKEATTFASNSGQLAEPDTLVKENNITRKQKNKDFPDKSAVKFWMTGYELKGCLCSHAWNLLMQIRP